MNPSDRPSAPGVPGGCPLAAFGKHSVWPPAITLPLTSTAPLGEVLMNCVLAGHNDGLATATGIGWLANRSVVLEGLVIMNCWTSPASAPSGETPETSSTTRRKRRSRYRALTTIP